MNNDIRIALEWWAALYARHAVDPSNHPETRAEARGRVEGLHHALVIVADPRYQTPPVAFDGKGTP